LLVPFPVESTHFSYRPKITFAGFQAVLLKSGHLYLKGH